jgi:hypothetical protein
MGANSASWTETEFGLRLPWVGHNWVVLGWVKWGGVARPAPNERGVSAHNHRGNRNSHFRKSRTFHRLNIFHRLLRKPMKNW